MNDLNEIKKRYEHFKIGVLCELKAKYKWFHLSKKDLGEKFTFTPRAPVAPYNDKNGDIIEDYFTERVSWAPSIKKAYLAIQDYVYSDDVLYVYAVNSLEGEVDLQDEFELCHSNLSTKGNKYNTDWEYDKFLKWAAKKDKKDPDDIIYHTQLSKELENCVPDALETDEHWSTKPIVAKKIGVFKNGKIRQVNEVKFRETQLASGKKTQWGSDAHIKELEKRITDLSLWRDRQTKGSEVRANYARLVNKLKAELKSAKRSREKRELKEIG